MDHCTSNEQSMDFLKQQKSGIKVRDMIRRYDSALKSDQEKISSSVSNKSSYCGLNVVDNDNGYNSMFSKTDQGVQNLTRTSSRSSSINSRKTIRASVSPTNEISYDPQLDDLQAQKSFINLSRTKTPPQAAPREKRARRSKSAVVQDEIQDMNTNDVSYQSKTTISKIPNGVRIIVDIFFDQNKGLCIDDVVRSRIETDIPPSKILSDFQRRVSDNSRN